MEENNEINVKSNDKQNIKKKRGRKPQKNSEQVLLDNKTDLNSENVQILEVNVQKKRVKPKKKFNQILLENNSNINQKDTQKKKIIGKKKQANAQENTEPVVIDIINE